MKIFLLLILVSFSTQSFSQVKSTFCSDAAGKWRYEYALDPESDHPWIHIEQEGKVLFKRLPFIEEPLVNKIQFAFDESKTHKLNFKIQEKRFSDQDGYSSTISTYYKKLSITHREDKHVMLDSYVICESTQMAKILLSR